MLFYSSWIYSYLRLLTSIEHFQTFEALVEEIALPSKTVRKALDFLVSRGLCKEEKERLVYASKPTYVDANSPLVVRHHMNWREQAQKNLKVCSSEDLVFTYPTTISEKDFQIIREKLVQFIEEFKKNHRALPF